MSYSLRMSDEMHDWLADLRDSDPARAMLVGQALTALMSDGTAFGPPLVIPLAYTAWPRHLAEALDQAYRRGLQWTQAARVQVAQAAAVAQRLRGQIAALESLPAGEQAEAADQLAGRRRRLDEVTKTEKKLIEESQRRQRKLEAFRTRKDILNATYAAAQAEVAVPDALADAGPDGNETESLQQERDAAASKLRDIEQEIERELQAAPWAEGHGDLRPQPGLMGLQPGAPDTEDLRIIFAVEPPGSVLLLALLDGRDAQRDHYDEAVSLSSEVLRHVRDGQAPEAVAHAYDDVPSFLDGFFAGEAIEVEAGAAELTARNRARKLAELRDRLGLSQVEVAERMGVRPARVAAIERAERGATEVRTLAGYVEALGGRLEVIADVGGERVVLR